MKRFLLPIALILLNTLHSFSQNNNADTLKFTLKDVIEIAQKQSPDILMARHNFRSQYWSYISYKANYLPSLNFRSTPNFNHWINAITLEDGTQKFVQQNMLQTDAVFSIDQNIALTGGTLSLQTSLQRIDAMDDKTYSYKSTPLSVTYQQSLMGYNSLKWDQKIEPLRFEEAKKTYVENLELVASRAVSMFFGLAMAQANLEIARTNYANADTLYYFAQGRYNIGTITENEMLQLEIGKLQGETSLMDCSLGLDDAMEDIRTFLGIKSAQIIEVIIDNEILLEFVDQLQALKEAEDNSPNSIYMERRKLESDNNVARVKGNVGLKADLYMQFGLAQTGRDIEMAYQDPLNQQYVQVGIRLPILDWGREKGQVEVAKSSRDITYMQMDQDKNTFEMNIKKTVKQFNLQANQLLIAAKADYTAQRRHDVTQRLYLLGRATILELNSSVSDKDTARRSYLSTLRTYWSLYYALRSMTLYDFEKNIPITEDYKLLVK